MTRCSRRCAESRGYATEDKNLEIRYTLDDAVMGSTLDKAAGADGYVARVEVHDEDGAEDAVTLIEIVSDGGEVVAASPAFDSADVTWVQALPKSTARYYWVRVTTASDFWGNLGVTAWTAPVWTGR